MKNELAKLCFIACIPILIIFFGCTKSCDNSHHIKKDHINIALSNSFESLDPRYATSAVASRLSKLIYAPLFIIDKDISLQPFLAKEIKRIDTTNFQVILRDNLFFHNGKRLTAKDVVYTFNTLGSEDVASPHAAKFDYIESIKPLDEKTILFSLKKPYAPFITDLAAIGIVSKKVCKGRSQKCRHEHIGSGPYMVKTFNNATETLTLTPFENWFEKINPPALSFHVVRDENTRFLELIGKKTDILDSNISPQNILELKKHDHIKVLKNEGLGYTYLAINLRNADNNNQNTSKTKNALAHKKVRQAMAHAIDFNKIITNILHGYAKRVSGLIPNGHWAKDETLKPPAFNQDIAKKLLDEAGFKIDPQTKMRFALTISTTPNRMRQNIAMLIADYLKKVGIDASIRVKEWSALYQDMKKGNFEVFSAVWVPVTEPDLYTWVHHSKSIPNKEKPGGNRHGYKNPKVDKLIERAQSTMDVKKRKNLYHKIERILLNDLPYIPLWNEHRIAVINKNRIKNYKPQKTGSLLGLRKAVIEY